MPFPSFYFYSWCPSRLLIYNGLWNNIPTLYVSDSAVSEFLGLFLTSYFSFNGIQWFACQINSSRFNLWVNTQVTIVISTFLKARNSLSFISFSLIFLLNFPILASFQCLTGFLSSHRTSLHFLSVKSWAHRMIN